MPEKRKLSRRHVLKTALSATATGMALPTFVSCTKKTPSTPEISEAELTTPGPNDQIGVGIIGCGRRNAQLQIGRGDQGKPPPEARIVAVADLNLTRARQWGEKHKAEVYQDYRKMLERKDVDVVVYATPEHWHYLPCIHACQAGKDIYGEQPLGHTIAEGRMMANAARKYNRVFQTGEQQRSHPATRKAAELIINGRIGKIKEIVGYNYPSPFECGLPGEPVPDGLDWDRWCGPNEVVPYNVNLYLSRIPYERTKEWPNDAEENAVGPGWMSFRPYSGGELVNWGCHGLSMVQWVLQLDQSGPTEVWVEPDGRKLESLVYDSPETRDRGDAHASRSIIHYRFSNDIILKLSSTDKKLGGGAKFIGEKGEITIFRNGYQCNPVGLDQDPLPSDAKRLTVSDNHMQNFYDCVSSRADPIMHIEAGHRVATLCHLGNIARWLGRRLQWDPAQEVFPGDDEANQYLDTPKRKEYALPDKV
jgi:predicted dehydrogenase